jgi:uracil DNA glycosylase
MSVTTIIHVLPTTCTDWRMVMMMMMMMMMVMMMHPVHNKSINTGKHFVISAAHPSPLSAKLFFGCKVFSKTNKHLQSRGLTPIDWNVTK